MLKEREIKEMLIEREEEGERKKGKIKRDRIRKRE